MGNILLLTVILQSVSVSKGQEVKTGQVLGKLADIGQLEFVLSDEKDHLSIRKNG